MIEVQDLTKKYGEIDAVKGLTFKVEPGRIWGLLGPNGAGKTTTMRILTGYLPATSGVARVAGHDVFNEPDAVKRAIGYLPEVVPLYQDMTVSGYLAFVAEIKQVAKAKRQGGRRPGPRVGRPQGRRAPAHPEHLPRLQAAGRHRPGHDQRPPGPHPGRADDRPRPGPDHGDPGAHQGPPRRAHDPPLDPHPARGHPGLRRRRHHQRGRAQGLRFPRGAGRVLRADRRRRPQAAPGRGGRGGPLPGPPRRRAGLGRRERAARSNGAAAATSATTSPARPSSGASASAR